MFGVYCHCVRVHLIISICYPSVRHITTLSTLVSFYAHLCESFLLFLNLKMVTMMGIHANRFAIVYWV